MSAITNSITINEDLSKFFTVSKKDSGFDANDVINIKDGGAKKAGTFHDWNIFRLVARSKAEVKANNDTRQKFLDSLKRSFGLTETGKELVDRLGKILGKEFKSEDYAFDKNGTTVNCGRPLTKRRIGFVEKEVKQVSEAFKKYLAGVQLSKKSLSLLVERGLINEIAAKQVSVEGQVVEGRKEEVNVVSVVDPVQLLQKEGFEVKPTSRNGNTLINSLLPQVNDEYDQKNEFTSKEEDDTIKRLHSQLKGDNGLPDYKGRCHFSSYTWKDKGWEKEENPVERDFDVLDTGKEFLDREESNVKRNAANRSYRLLDLAARAYKRPVVLITMFEEDAALQQRQTPKKFVFGAGMTAEPICLYRDQDGNYSRLAYTEKGRKSAEYQEFVKSQEAPKEIKKHWDINGVSSHSFSEEEDLRKQGLLFDSPLEAYKARQQKIENGEEPGLWEGEVPKIEKKEEKPVEVKPKVEEKIDKSVKSESEKEVEKIYQEYLKERNLFRNDLRAARDAYLESLNLGKGKRMQPADELDYNLFDQHYEYRVCSDPYSRFHSGSKEQPKEFDKGALNEAIKGFKTTREEIKNLKKDEYLGLIKDLMQDVRDVRKSGQYLAVMQMVADRLHATFVNVPEESIKRLAAEDFECHRRVALAVEGVVLRGRSEMTCDLEGLVDGLVKLLTPAVKKAAVQQKLEALEERQGDRSRTNLTAHLEQEAENRRKLEAQQKLEAQRNLEAQQKLETMQQKLVARQKQKALQKLKSHAEQVKLAKEAPERIATMTKALEKKCKEHAKSRFDDLYHKVVESVYNEKSFVKPMEMQFSEAVINRFTDMVVAKGKKEIEEAAWSGKTLESFEALDDKDANAVLRDAFNEPSVREAVDADIKVKLLGGLVAPVAVRRVMLQTRYFDLVSFETMRPLFNVWQTADAQQEQPLTEFVSKVGDQLGLRASEYESKLIKRTLTCKPGLRKGALEGEPAPMGDDAFEQRQKELAALLTGLTQMRTSVLDNAKGGWGKKARAAEANVSLAEKVRPKLVKAVVSIVADGVAATEAIGNLIAELKEEGGLNAFVPKDKWGSIQNEVNNAIGKLLKEENKKV